MKPQSILSSALRGLVPVAMAALLAVCPAALKAQKSKPSAPAPKPAAASHPSTPASRGGAPAGGASRGAAPTGASRGGAPAGGASRGASPAGASRGPSAAGGASRGGSPAAGGNRGGAAGASRGGAAGGASRGGASGGRPGSGAGGSRGNSARVGGRPAPPGGRVHEGRAGAASFDRRGNVRDVHAHGMDIHHGPGGSRTIVRERPGGVRVVSYRGGGYISHPYMYHGAAFARRTYWVNGVAYGRFYRPYVWGGVAFDVYAPGYYFAPAFYGWAYNPWRAPIVYAGWGWAGNPWFGFYGGWFAPYPTYVGPAYWLTDYFVAQSLMAAYAEQQAAAAAAAAAAYSAPLNVDIKNLVAAEVQRQLALENSEAANPQAAPDPASSGIARELSDGTQHIFVVSAGIDVQSNAGGECFVTQGDVLQLQGTVPAGQPANLVVLATKGQDCPKGATVQVQVADLQEMQNHMRETVDQGLTDLQKKQGQGGIPAAPAGSAAPPQQTAFAAIAPPPDPNVQGELTQQNQEADQAEKEVLAEAKQDASGPSDSGQAYNAPAAAPAPTKKATIGMSVDEIVAGWGQPKDIVDLGEKKIYVYDGMKFTFVKGKMTSAQ